MSLLPTRKEKPELGKAHQMTLFNFKWNWIIQVHVWLWRFLSSQKECWFQLLWKLSLYITSKKKKKKLPLLVLIVDWVCKPEMKYYCHISSLSSFVRIQKHCHVGEELFSTLQYVSHRWNTANLMLFHQMNSIP